MKVLVNSWRDLAHPNAGGSELIVDQLANSLTARGHDVVVRCGGPLAAPRSYRVMAGGGTYSQYLLTPMHQWRYFRDRDVVVDVVNGMGFYSPLFTNLPTVAMIHHIHTDQWPMYYGKAVAKAGNAQEQRLVPWAYRHSLIVCSSPSTKHDLVDMGIHTDRIRTYPIDCELPATSATRSTEPLFVVCGRVTAHKRIPKLLQMWDRVRPSTGGRLVVIGDGPDLDQARSFAGEGVEFAGRVSDQRKAELFRQAWVLVHGAAFEGWGLVITEAGLVRTPSIGFDVRGVRHAILHDKTGLLAGTDDEFVQHWIDLAGDPARRNAMGDAAHRYARELSAVDRDEAFEQVLTESIALHKARKEKQIVRQFPVGIDLRLKPASGTVAGPQNQSLATSIVIPAFNEAARIGPLLENLPNFVNSDVTEVLVVDDGSADNTAAVAAQAMAPGLPHGRVISQPSNGGKGAALRAGVAAARGRRVVFMDADQATDLNDLDALLAALDHSHVAIGSRTALDATVANGALHRRVMAQGFNLMVRGLTQLDLRDSQCGFKAFRGPVARLLFHLSEVDGFAQDVEILDMASRLGLSIAEVPVRWTAVAGSKVSPVKDSVLMARDLAKHRLRPQNAGVLTGLSIDIGHRTAPTAAKEVASCLRATDPVIHDNDRVHVLLPGIESQYVPSMARRVGQAIETNDVSCWSLDARSLLRYDHQLLGPAIRRIGEAII